MTTTSSPSEPEANVAPRSGHTLPAAPTEERPPIRGPLRKLLLTLLPTNIAVFVVYGAVLGVMLPIQITGINPANKVANLAIVTTIGAFAAMVAQPIAGAISDRTRSRFGRRAPWMVLGVLIGGLALVGMAIANSLVQILIAWTIVQIAFNFCQGPLSAVIPDRVPVRAYAIFAALGGMAAMIGSVGGPAIGAIFAQGLGAGYLLLAGIAMIAVVLFVLLNPDTSSRDTNLEPFRLLRFVRNFWVSPRNHPDFFWAFLGRLLLFTGYFSVTGYNFYLLSNYVGLGDKAAGFVAVLGLLGLAGMVPSIIIAGIVSDRVGRRKIFVFISSILVGIGLFIPIIAPTVTGMCIMAFVAGLGFGSFQAVDQALMNQVLPSADSFAKDLGVVNIAATLPQTIAPALGGAIVLLFGYIGVFPVGIALTFVGAFAVWFIRSVR